MSLMIRFSIGKGPGIELLMCYYDSNQVSSDTRGRGGARVKIKKKMFTSTRWDGETWDDSENKYSPVEKILTKVTYA